MESLFSIVVLNYYDGPTSGVIQCDSCLATYKFTMIDWDDYQNVRVHAFAPLPSESFRRIVDLLSKYEPPKWPIWYPLRPYASDQLYDSVEKQIHESLELAEPATLAVALSQWGEKVLAVRNLSESDMNDVKDWFSLEDPKAARDWFDFMGLVRKIDESNEN